MVAVQGDTGPQRQGVVGLLNFSFSSAIPGHARLTCRSSVAVVVGVLNVNGLVLVTQLIEHQPLDQKGRGSSPRQDTLALLLRRQCELKNKNKKLNLGIYIAPTQPFPGEG
jgi:hypothetical protein